MVTPPMRWVNGELAVNADPRHDITAHPGYGGGELRAEVRDARGKALPGFAFDDCIPMLHNTAHRNRQDGTLPILWKSGKKMASLAGRRIALAFKLRDAHLYSFKAKRAE